MVELKAMIVFSPQEIADIVQGKIVGIDDKVLEHQPAPYSVVVDSRQAGQGALFVAKPGEHSDGHLYVGKAFAQGTALALLRNEVADEHGRVFPAVIVDDVVLAMGQLAKAHIRKIRLAAQADGEQLNVIGITGSVGKTTAKDLIAHILGQKAATVFPVSSYNGEVGVPLTAFSANEKTRFLVIEMGATKPGNITYLCDMVKPDSAVVLNVGTAHVGEFGGRENIAKAKAEILRNIPEDGYAVLNIDDPQVRAMRVQTKARVLEFFSQPESFSAGSGQQGIAETTLLVQATDVVLDSVGHLRSVLHFPAATIAEYESAVADGVSAQPVRFELKTALVGLHHITNVLAAASLAYSQNISADELVAALHDKGATNRYRMERIVRDDGVVVINDAYNASPESMRAALQTLAVMGREVLRQGHRTWAVLGAMLELGADSAVEHDAIGRLVVRLNISKLIVVGHNARAMYVAAVMEGSWADEALFVDTMDEAEHILKNELSSGDIVLFKSSNGCGLRLLGDKVANHNRSDD